MPVGPHRWTARSSLDHRLQANKEVVMFPLRKQHQLVHQCLEPTLLLLNLLPEITEKKLLGPGTYATVRNK
jgi:hypothetical protein